MENLNIMEWNWFFDRMDFNFISPNQFKIIGGLNLLYKVFQPLVVSQIQYTFQFHRRFPTLSVIPVPIHIPHSPAESMDYSKFHTYSIWDPSWDPEPSYDIITSSFKTFLRSEQHKKNREWIRRSWEWKESMDPFHS